jgi:hypothetical protein
MTKHMNARMNQRGITRQLVDLALAHGDWNHDECRLDPKRLRMLISDLDALRASALRALDKGGVAVVETGGKLVTTYSRLRKQRRH